MTTIIVSIICAVLGSSAVGTILVKILERKWNREDKHDEIMSAIQGLKTDINNLNHKNREQDAINSRVRILSFADQENGGYRHGKGSWDQVILDCDTYEKYCEEHAEFENGITHAAVNMIRTKYDQHMMAGDFVL